MRADTRVGPYKIRFFVGEHTWVLPLPEPIIKIWDDSCFHLNTFILFSEQIIRSI
jgi:hypothetical protein